MLRRRFHSYNDTTIRDSISDPNCPSHMSNEANCSDDTSSFCVRKSKPSSKLSGTKNGRELSKYETVPGIDDEDALLLLKGSGAFDPDSSSIKEPMAPAKRELSA